MRLEQFKTEMILCPTCNGRGKHVNPSIDGNGITSSEMDELGDDFFDDYMGGMFDVICMECQGNNVIEVVIESLLDPEELKDLLDQREYDAICEAERRAGC